MTPQLRERSEPKLSAECDPNPALGLVRACRIRLGVEGTSQRARSAPTLGVGFNSPRPQHGSGCRRREGLH